MNIAMHLVRAGRAFGERPGVAQGEAVVLSYAALADRAARLGGSLAGKLALKHGDRVAIVLGNCPEYLELLYACWHAGLVAVPINAKLHPSELAYVIENSGAKACFSDHSLAEQLSPLQGQGLHHLLCVTEAGYRSLLVGGTLEPVDRAPDDPAWLFYTSGTTGRPKGAVLSHRNLLAMCFCYLTDVNPGAPWRCVLHAAPMSHGSGLYGLAHVMQGSCHVIPEQRRFDPDEIYGLIHRWPGISFFAAPTMVKRLVEHPREVSTSELKTIVYGGGPMYLEDCRAAIDRFGPKLSQLYGQGESPMTITALNAQMHADHDHPRWLQRLASVGIAQSAVDVRVAAPDGRFLPAEEVGEILVRGDTVMKGYWANPEATAEALSGGWLHTGDMGEFDRDGFLTLKDRGKDMIISGGSNIYPREIEEVLLQYPGISAVSVIGRPDRHWGETVVAYIVANTGIALDPAALDRFMIEHLARFKRPRDYRVVTSLPKNHYGKVLKTRLREIDRKRSEPRQ